MANNHIITKNIGNLRGFSTDSIFLRPANVADRAVNIQRAPDGTLQLRRGYQCQIANIGGMGLGTFDNPATDSILTVTLSTDGFLYNKLTRQLYFQYDGRIMGDITDVTNPSADLTNIESVGHGLQTGAQVIIRNVGGAVELNNPSTFGMTTYNYYTITVVDADNFTLDGIPFSDLSPYTSGGDWSVNFADNRYLTMSIYVDPEYIYTISDQSIACDIIENRSAQVNGTQNNTNIITVQYGHDFLASNVVQFYTSVGVFTQRNVTAVTGNTVTIDGDPVSVLDGAFLNKLTFIPFGKGFDVISTINIDTFIGNITDPVLGIRGLLVDWNGRTDLPAAFLQIFEPIIIPSGGKYQMDYWYWDQINSTINPPFPGSANIKYQNSPDFENASMAAFDDVIFICNGWDYPQKYDGQTVYRAGMPPGARPVSLAENNTFTSKPFMTGEVYQYATNYEQVDNRGHIVEGEISEVRTITLANNNRAIDIEVANLFSTTRNNWNTNGANRSGAGSVTSYGPDVNGFYYNFVPVDVAYTLKIGDTAYYGDTTAAQFTTDQSGTVFDVTPGYSVVPGDEVYFFDSTDHEIHRVISQVVSDPTGPTYTITITGGDVTISPSMGAPYVDVLVYKQSKVFANVAIVDGNQNGVNNILVKTGHNVQVADVVQFIDANNNMQERTVVSVNATHVEVDQNPVDVLDLYLIQSTNQRADSVTFQRFNPNAATLTSGAPISNNLRINIYRTLANESFGVNGELYLVASIPNDSSGPLTQHYIDGLIGITTGGVTTSELGRQFDDPDQLPNPPPVAKYVKAFGNQVFYAGGERGIAENSDRVFFSDGNSPEVVPLASNFFNVPNVDDDITGIGVSGSTLITTKNHSLWAATGNFLSGQIDVVQIAPGTNIGCVAHATIASVGTLMYFVHTNGVYAITENQLFPTDAFGNPIPISLAIDALFRETPYLPYNRYVFKRAVAFNYTKDNQYLLFLPCEDAQSLIRTANSFSVILCYDYQEKNWFTWNNMNAAGGMAVIDDDLYFQERRFSRVDGNTANLYKQHRFYRLIDHADHAGAQFCEWRSSWEDLGQPEVRKKFCRCILLMDRLSELYQYNNPQMTFSSYLNRLTNLQNTIAQVTQVDNIRNSSWSFSPWGWNYWSGYQDSFIAINLKQGTVAKSMQVGLQIQGINMDIRLAGFQLEIIPENRKTVVR